MYSKYFKKLFSETKLQKNIREYFMTRITTFRKATGVS